MGDAQMTPERARETTDYKGVALKVYNRVAAVVQSLEDEGDRVYLGSTNDADILREIADERDANYIIGEPLLTSEQEAAAYRKRAEKAEAAYLAEHEARVAAEAAQALVLGQAAEIADGYHQRAIEWAKKVRGLDQHIDETDSSRIAKDIRALASPSGVEELTKLRARTDEAEKTLAYCEKQWADTDRVTHAKMLDERTRAETAEAEAATLRTRLAEAEGKVAALTEARRLFHEACNTYNVNRHMVQKRRAENDWSLTLDEDYKAMEQARRDFIGAAEDFADAALAAVKEAEHG